MRFHAVYWPAFLMSAGIDLPRRIFSHGFLFNRGEKMSKSVGNVIDPFALVDAYGVDQFRYFVLREVPFGQDGNYSHEAIVNRINADLANDLGNLAQRSLTMVARAFGGALPQPGAFIAADQAILGAADALVGKAREAMATQQLHQVLNAVWVVVADANRYFAGQAPWALAKTDPVRQGTVLYVTAEVLRQIAILAQPFMPESASKLLDLLGVRPPSAIFHSSAAHTGSLPAPRCQRRRRYFRATSSPGARGAISNKMLIDSHCHLDFPDFAAELDAVVLRARQAGIARMVTISTRVRRQDELLAIADRFDDVYCSVGTHPHYAHEETDVTAADLVARTQNKRVVALGEAGLDYHYDNSPRDAQEHGFRTHIAAARETGLPLVIHTREADDDTARILEEETGRGPFPAVLHCFTGGADLARRAVALGHFISFTGILTFKNSAALRAIAAELPADRILVETDAPYLAPGRHRGKRNEPAFVIETANVLAEARGVSFDEIARQTTDNFFRLFTKVPRPAPASAAEMAGHDNEIHNSGLRIVGRRAAPGARLGRVRSQQSEKPAAAHLAVGRAARRRRHHARPGRHLARSARTASRCRRRPPRWRALHARARRPHPRHRRSARALHQAARSRSTFISTSIPPATMHARFGYCFKAPPGSEYPPIVRERRLVAGTPVTITGQGGPITALPVLQEHGDIASLGFRFGNVAYSADIGGLPDDSAAALHGLDVWIVDALRDRPHPSHFSVADALSWIERLEPRRAILTNLHADLDYETLREKLPPHVEPAYDGISFAIEESPV